MRQAKSLQEALPLPQPLLHDTPSGTLITTTFLLSVGVCACCCISLNITTADMLASHCYMWVATSRGLDVQSSTIGKMQKPVDAAGMRTTTAHMW